MQNQLGNLEKLFKIKTKVEFEKRKKAGTGNRQSCTLGFCAQIVQKFNTVVISQKRTLRLNEASLQAVGLKKNDLSVSYQAVLASICFIFAK